MARQDTKHRENAVKRVQLADGREAVLRPIRPDDRAGFLALHRGLSEDSRHFRYFTGTAPS